jgi:hypothetical protein
MTSPEVESYEGTAIFLAHMAAIAEAMHTVRTSNRSDSRVLRDAVRVSAAHAREHGCPPEKLVRALKSVVREVALHDSSDAYRVLFTDRIIAWAIESYYELAER